MAGRKQQDLIGRWLHSYEEDVGDQTVYRPANYAFPPARGRTGFELKENGVCEEILIGPTDTAVHKKGQWRYTRSALLVLTPRTGTERRFRVVSLRRDRLVLLELEG